MIDHIHKVLDEINLNQKETEPSLPPQILNDVSFSSTVAEIDYTEDEPDDPLSVIDEDVQEEELKERTVPSS